MSLQAMQAEVAEQQSFLAMIAKNKGETTVSIEQARITELQEALTVERKKTEKYQQLYLAEQTARQTTEFKLMQAEQSLQTLMNALYQAQSIHAAKQAKKFQIPTNIWTKPLSEDTLAEKESIAERCYQETLFFFREEGK